MKGKKVLTPQEQARILVKLVKNKRVKERMRAYLDGAKPSSPYSSSDVFVSPYKRREIVNGR